MSERGSVRWWCTGVTAPSLVLLVCISICVTITTGGMPVALNYTGEFARGSTHGCCGPNPIDIFLLFRSRCIKSLSHILRHAALILVCDLSFSLSLSLSLLAVSEACYRRRCRNFRYFSVVTIREREEEVYDNRWFRQCTVHTHHSPVTRCVQSVCLCLPVCVF